MSSADPITTIPADILRQCSERVFHTRLTDLLEALVIGRATAHSIKILRNDWMVIGWVGKPVQVYRPGITGIGSNRDSNLSPCRAAIFLRHGSEVSHDHVRPRNCSNGRHDVPVSYTHLTLPTS